MGCVRTIVATLLFIGGGLWHSTARADDEDVIRRAVQLRAKSRLSVEEERFLVISACAGSEVSPRAVNLRYAALQALQDRSGLSLESISALAGRLRTQDGETENYLRVLIPPIIRNNGSSEPQVLHVFVEALVEDMDPKTHHEIATTLLKLMPTDAKLSHLLIEAAVHAATPAPIRKSLLHLISQFPLEAILVESEMLLVSNVGDSIIGEQIHRLLRKFPLRSTRSARRLFALSRTSEETVHKRVTSILQASPELARFSDGAICPITTLGIALALP